MGIQKEYLAYQSHQDTNHSHPSYQLQKSPIGALQTRSYGPIFEP
jgi:hypothetical protein